ncbi:hypothetical protein JQ633_22695 [Bradyrhizobium tropiciagri]|uniref:hypothetical protein n=1 Tax=Bradyrhizobium tropiciagri TaxID=312253 RepID=UPI001BA80C0A|nr:hypothetical protein [Bradyrhizobium tropiciagri]MBR0873183.1 hypothetical protein [Bradyrhizobium tropiciagri]
MTGQGGAQQSGTHRSIRFVITEGETAGIWRYSFSIGGRNFTGKMQAVLGLLAARRVKIKIDRLLKQQELAKAQAGAEPDVARNPSAPPPAARSAASTNLGDGPESVPQKAEGSGTVAFACESCNVAYEAVQVCTAGKGIFRCAVCDGPVHQWDGAYHYRNWRRLEEDAGTRLPPTPSAGYED